MSITLAMGSKVVCYCYFNELQCLPFEFHFFQSLFFRLLLYADDGHRKIRNFYGTKKLMARKFFLHVYGKSFRWSIVKMINIFFFPYFLIYFATNKISYAGAACALCWLRENRRKQETGISTGKNPRRKRKCFQWQQFSFDQQLFFLSQNIRLKNTRRYFIGRVYTEQCVIVDTNVL